MLLEQFQRAEGLGAGGRPGGVGKLAGRECVLIDGDRSVGVGKCGIPGMVVCLEKDPMLGETVRTSTHVRL